MASSAPSSPQRARHAAEPRLRPPLVSSRSIPSSSSTNPSSPSRGSSLLSPRTRMDDHALPTPPSSSTSSVGSSAVPSPPPSSSNVAGMLRVEVMSARNLHAAVLGSLLKWTPNFSNPYVVATLHRDEFSTTTKDKTLNPTWKEMGQLKVPLPTEQELLQTAGLHRSVHDTGGGHSGDSTKKLGGGALSVQKLHGKGAAGGQDFHACYPHLLVQVYHRSELTDGQQPQQPVAGAARLPTDQLIGEVTVPVLPCLLSTSSSHRAWYTLLSDEHPEAGQIQIAMHYDVGGLEPLKGDIVRLAGFCGMEYYSKLVNANARLEVADVFQDEVVVQCKSIEGWVLSFELHRNLLFVVRRPSILRDAQSQLQGQIVRVRHSPIVARVHNVWQAIPVQQRHQLHQIYDLALFSGGAVYGVVTRTVHTAVNEGVHAGVQTCMAGSSEAVNMVSMEAVRVLWRSHSTSRTPPRPTRAEETRRHLEGGPLSGRGKIVHGFGDQSAMLTATGTIDEEEKTSEVGVVEFVVDEEEEEVEAEALSSFADDENETSETFDEEHKTNEGDEDTDAENEKYWIANCPDQLLCPITGCPMIDPVVAADGHSYEREAILQWLATSNISPMTGAQMNTTQVISNFTLRKLSEEFQAKMRSSRER